MAKKIIDEEPMLEESSEEILLEETSGEETLLEESADSESLLEENGETEVLLEESSDEVLLEESAKPESQHQTTQKPVSAVSTLNKNTASRKRSPTQGKTTQGKTTTQETHTKAPSGNTSSSSRQISSNRPKAKRDEPNNLPIWELAFAWGLPITLVFGVWIFSIFDDDSHGLGAYLFVFLSASILTNFLAARNEDLPKGQRKYFVVPLIILILISGILIWLGIRSSMNQPATKETYTYINDRFLVKNVFIVEINDGDTLLNLKNQGLCELVDDHLYERIKPKYDSIGYFAQSTNDVEMFIIKQDGKYGLVDKEDEELVEPKYMRIEVPDEEVKTQDGDKLFKAYTNNTTELYSYAPKYYGQLQDK